MGKSREDLFKSRQPIRLLSVIVAAYNEEKTIENSMGKLRGALNLLNFPSEIIVVESNSTDLTRKILTSAAHDLGLTLYFQNRPQGKGSAIRLGLSKISGDVFLIYDADDEYDPMDIPALLMPISSGTTSFVLGTRHEKGRAMRIMDDHKIRPFVMNIAHKFFTKLINIFFNVELTDPFTMYKVFRIGVFKEVELVSDRFDLDWELVAKAIRRGARPVEVPVNYKARSFSEGKKIRFIRDPITWIIALIRFRISPL